MRYSELERLVCAAAINGAFRAQLLRNPHQAARSGFQGQPFALTQEEFELLGTADVSDFQRFAEQIGQWIAVHRNGHFGNGHGNGHGNGRHKRLTAEELLALPLYEPT